MILDVAQVTVSFGPTLVLNGASFRIDRKEKVALVGRNGCGKTTLLKVIVGELEPDRGAVTISRGAKVGYLRQRDPVDLSGTIYEEAEKALGLALGMKRRLLELEERLEDSPSDEELAEYAALHEHFLDAEGYSAERDIRTVLLKMGFREDDFDKPAKSLSGGERTRLALARQILEEPDLLILDEPTNHLDLSATEWLESWLQSYPGAVLVISHDRTFLESVGSRFLDLRDGQIHQYPGPYSKFVALREAEAERQAEIARRQEQEIAKLDEFVRRFINSQRTAEAKGRRTKLERLIESRVQAPSAQRSMAAGISSERRSGDRVLSVKGLSAAFGGRTLFKNLDWTVSIGERWGVIGDNGTGKSTLVRMILGLADLQQGEVKIGSKVDLGYFSQDAENLDPGLSPLEMVMARCGLNPGPARNLLGQFLITGDDVFRPIRTLSGGERNKLALALLVQSRPNLLVLDEPTNHLDLDSREALGKMLAAYDGTMVLVSHDRWLLGNVTNRTLHLRRDGFTTYNGSYSEYRLSLRQAETVRPLKRDVPKPESAQMTPREVSKAVVRLSKQVADLEEQIGAKENELRLVEEKLAGLLSPDEALEYSKRYASIRSELDLLLEEWNLRADELSALSALQGR